MKKVISIMLALVMVLGLMSVGVAAADIATYNFYNSSTTADALSADFMLSDHSGAFRFAISTDKANSGTTSLATTGTANGDMYIKIPNPTVGVTYTLSAWYYTEADAKLALFLRTAPVAGTQANSVTTGTSVTTAKASAVVPTKNAWAQYTVDYKHTQANHNKITDGLYFMFRAGAGIIYIDDITVTDDTVVTEEPTEYAVTINTVEGATTSVAAATSEGEAVNYTVKPQFGYYIAGITVGGEAYTGFDAYKGGTYSTGDIEADTAIVVTVASLSENDKGVSTDVATLPAAFGSVESSVTFGKVLDASATSYGVELTQNGEGVLTYHGGGPLYKANSKTAEGQYAVEFVGLEAGTYQVRTYVIVDGVKTFGAPTTFTVE